MGTANDKVGKVVTGFKVHTRTLQWTISASVAANIFLDHTGVLQWTDSEANVVFLGFCGAEPSSNSRSWGNEYKLSPKRRTPTSLEDPDIPNTGIYLDSRAEDINDVRGMWSRDWKEDPEARMAKFPCVAAR